MSLLLTTTMRMKCEFATYNHYENEVCLLLTTTMRMKCEFATYDYYENEV